MAKLTSVAIRFTKDIADIRRTGFVNALSRKILQKLRAARPPEERGCFTMQWFRLPNEPFLFCVNVWGKHETAEAREVVADVARECAEKELPVLLDIVNP